MYREYYGLTADPFRLSPDHAFCLPHRSFAKAKAYMRYAMHRGEGFVMITGAPGTGKTTLIDDLLAGIEESNFSIGRLVSVQVEADDILRLVAGEFGISASQADKSEILRLLSDQLMRNFKLGKRSLLIVDEAQGLSLSALEELRLLTNMRVGGHPMLQIFLVGQEELREMVTSPELEQLNQRMIAAYHMEPLKPDEFVAYVLHRLTVAGWKGDPRFKPELFPELFRFSNGLPRRINHICSRLLLHGFLEEKRWLDEEDMEIVIKELRAEHYSIRENSALINQEEFNPEDLQRMARSAMSGQAKKTKSRAGTMRREEAAEELHAHSAKVVDITPKLPRQSAATPVERPESNPAVGTQREDTCEVRRARDSLIQFPITRLASWTVVSLLSIALFLLLLVLVPTQQLNRVASQTVWDNVGLTGIRTRVSNWSGGRLPLKGARGFQLRPVAPAAIERIEERPTPESGKIKTAASENPESSQPPS